MYYARHLEGALTDRRSRNKVKLLLGPRQSGKSTLLRHCLAGRTPTVRNLQDRRLRMKYERDTATFLQELDMVERGSTVVVDEIQKVPAILDDVQYLFDEDQDRFDFFLTGSSARKLRKDSANLLPGRVHLFHMTPVLQAEQRDAEVLPLPMSPMSSAPRFPRRSLEEYLVWGNLPGLYHEDPDSWGATLEAYSELYIEHEIRREALVQDIGAFMRFLSLAAAESGRLVNYSKLASAVGISVNTVRNYYQVLEDTHVGFRVPAYGRSRKKILAAPRFVMFDLGVRNCLARLPLNPSVLRLDAGSLFEQFVLVELFYRCLSLGREFRLSTWRTHTGAEVDAVVETPEEVLPVEVKWTDAPQKGDIRHLETFLDLHADEARRGLLVCRCDVPRKLSPRVVALPWDRF